MRWAAVWVAAVLAAPSAASCQDAAAVDDRVYRDAAERAWGWIDRNYHPSTGLVGATEHYALVTVWDVGSALMALYAAHELGLLPRDDYDRRMGAALRTLQSMPLYDGVAFNRLYSARTGQMHGRDERVTQRGYGWSATDLGRLLSVLKVIASNHTRFEADVDRVVRRMDYGRIIRDGYLWGEDVRPDGRVVKYPEGRVGYEQYAAQGFAVWGHRAERALDVRQNTRPVTVEGVPLLADRRGDDRLTSEPFVLGAMELDLWGDELNQLARGVLAAQEARWRRTGQVTVVSEDAVPVAPYHFYYYTVYHGGTPFAIDAQAPMRGVRVQPWISSKAAFAWHALHPGDYTATALRAVVNAHRGQRDWAAGVFEGTGRLTGGANVNTAAVILEAALYRERGRRLYSEPAAESAR